MNQIVDGEVLYDVDLISGKLTWNDALHTLLGHEVSPQTSTVEWWSAQVHPDDAMILNQAMDGLLNPGLKEWTVKYRFRKADNSYVLVCDQATVQRAPNGEAVRLTGSISPCNS